MAHRKMMHKVIAFFVTLLPEDNRLRIESIIADQTISRGIQNISLILPNDAIEKTGIKIKVHQSKLR